MDDVEKSKVRLAHWIDHNLDHLRGYAEVAHIMEGEGLSDAAERVRQGMRLIEEANGEFTKALAALPTRQAKGSESSGASAHGGGHSGEHHHHHGHEHGHAGERGHTHDDEK